VKHVFACRVLHENLDLDGPLIFLFSGVEGGRLHERGVANTTCVS
tara:strand:+ start:965 stop:1099 length:135 start_codon:yes stop_codon:yes gene_type:complete